MTARKHGVIVISVPGERSKPQRLDVSWTSNADKRKQVEHTVDAWARNIRKWWGVYADVTTLETEAGGKVFINNDHTRFVAQFSVQLNGEGVPAPVPALFAAGGAR